MTETCISKLVSLSTVNVMSPPFMLSNSMVPLGLSVMLVSASTAGRRQTTNSITAPKAMICLAFMRITSGDDLLDALLLYGPADLHGEPPAG